MKTAPFDLELAKQGHPLVSQFDTHGFVKSELVKIHPDGRLVVLVTDEDDEEEYIRYFYNNSTLNRRTLFLDVSTDWQPPFKFGQMIEVCDQLYEIWREHRFLAYAPSGKVITFDSSNEYEKYEDKDEFECYEWNHARHIPVEPTIEITVKVNGKESKLSDISKETLLKIREKN